MMFRARPLFVAMLLVLLAPTPAVEGKTAAAATVLETTPRERQVARMVTRFVERAHYAKLSVDDQLSAAILDTYIEALDPTRSYFLQSDISYFARYRHSLDDVLRSGDMDPVFDIFRLYRLRAQQHIGHALTVLEEKPDFAADEEYRFDRSKAPWPSSATEMQDFWRRRVKNDALGLLLADKTWEEASGILRKRYQRVLDRINTLDSDEVFETFMNAFARTLDPHSSYLSPKQSEEYKIQMSLSYQGIGASLQLNEEMVEIMGIIPGGPAAIDGRLKPGDRITAVGQGDAGEMVDVIGWQLDDVVQQIRGKSGTRVRLQVLPAGATPGSPETVLGLTRDKVKLEEQAARKEVISLDQDGEALRVGVIRIPSFYQDFDARNRGEKEYVSTTRDVRRLLNDLRQEDISALVLDLRGNGGGHLSEATSLTGLFIKRGPVVQLRDTNGRIEVLDDPEPALAYGGPLVVLVDRFSASASEIFAAAIQDYRRGIVIGQQTFGKGTVQNLYVLDQYAHGTPDPGLGQLTLTIGKFYRVTGGSTQHMGVIPDIELPSPIDATLIGESSRPRALPWDQIAAARFDASMPLDPAIRELASAGAQRLADDPDLRLLREEIAEATEIRAQQSVPLRLETRREERTRIEAMQLERENARRAARGLEPLKSLEELDPEVQTDALLQAAAVYAAELSRREAGQRLTQTSLNGRETPLHQ